MAAGFKAYRLQRRWLSSNATCTATTGHYCYHGARGCSAGAGHTVCTMAVSTVMSFGGGYWGPLGHGDKSNQLAPKTIAGLIAVRACSAGDQYTVCVMEDSTVKSFGWGSDGRLGHGDTRDQLMPKTIDRLIAVRACSAGGGRTVCVMEDSTVKSFGDGDALGHGDTRDELVPKTIDRLIAVRACSAGSSHTVCVMEDSTVKSFGSGGEGQLGHGDTSDQRAPKTIDRLIAVRACSAGKEHTVCVMEDSTVKSFGSNGGIFYYGQLGHGLGHGDNNDQLVPKTIAGLIAVRACSAGQYHTVCVMEDSTVKSFGSGSRGELGHGDQSDQLVPKLIAGLIAVRACSTGSLYTVCVMEDSTVKSFGQGGAGKLGHGDQSNQLAPKTIAGIPSAINGGTRACPGGKFQNASNQIACLMCAAGMFQPNTSQTSCLQCPRGAHCPSTELTKPRPCPYGHFADQLGLIQCKSCNSSCAAGQQREGCASQGLKSDDSKCRGGCPPGSFGVLLDSSFTAVCNRWAPWTRFDFDDGAEGTCFDMRRVQTSRCATCPRGYFQSSFGQTHCQRCGGCENGWYRKGCGNVSEGICTSCIPGKVMASIGKGSACTDCPTGRFSINGASCEPCPSGQYQDRRGRSFCNSVKGGHYLRQVAVSLDNGELGKQDIVTTCPSAGFLGETKCTESGLQYSDNFWRDGLESTNEDKSEWNTRSTYAVDNATRFYQCVHECSVNAMTGRITCDQGSTGILCSQCTNDFYADSSGHCVPCAHLTTETLATVVVIVLLVVLFVGTSIAYRRQLCQESACLSSALDKLQRFWQHAVATNLKLFITFFQMILLFRYVYQLTFPSLYLDFLAAFSFVNLNIFELLQMQCIFGSINFDSRMYVLGTLVLAMELAVAGIAFAKSKEGKAAEAGSTHAMLSRVQNALNILIFLLYPSVSSMLFQVHNCRRIEGVSYLHADYSIECDSSVHQSAAAYSIFLIVIVAIGIPILYLRLLSPHQHAIMKGSTESSRHLAFMYSDYKPRWWFWEVVVITLKLVMTGFAVWFAPGSLMQIIIGMLVLLVYSYLLLIHKPYCTHTHNSLAVFQTLMVFLSLFASLLLKIGDVVSSSNIDLGYSTGFITAALITAAVAILISSILGAARDYQLSILRVVVSTSETSWPPKEKETYKVGAIVRAKWLEGSEVMTEVVECTANNEYRLRLLHDDASGPNERDHVPVGDMRGNNLGEVEPIMRIVEDLCHARADMIFGYDWAGSSSGDVRDLHGSFRLRDIALGNVTSTVVERSSKIDWGDKDSIADSYWFKGYCDSVRAEVKTLCQMPHVAKVKLVCIEGGPITHVERAAMEQLVEETKNDLKEKGLEPNIEVQSLTFDEFKARFKQPLHLRLLLKIRGLLPDWSSSSSKRSSHDRDHRDQKSASHRNPMLEEIRGGYEDGKGRREDGKEDEDEKEVAEI